jgi:hypothetical protein
MNAVKAHTNTGPEFSSVGDGRGLIFMAPGKTVRSGTVQYSAIPPPNFRFNRGVDSKNVARNRHLNPEVFKNARWDFQFYIFTGPWSKPVKPELTHPAPRLWD